MILFRFCAILLLIIDLKTTWSLTLKCTPCAWCPNFNANETCDFFRLVLPSKVDRLEFDYNYGSRDTIINFQLGTTGAGFTTIPTEIFESFPNLVYFALKTDLEVISPNDWQNATSLIELRLYGHNVTVLRAHSFNAIALEKLQILRLSYSQLNTIERDAFVGLNNLTLLDLTDNKIHTIEDGAFDLPRVTTLYMAFNELTTLSDSTFCKLPNLQEVKLQYNSLKHIGRSLYCLTNIGQIYLDSNSIEDINLLEFVKLPRLSTLSLKKSGFSFDVTSDNVTTVENTSLKTLDLSANNLTNVLDLQKLNIFQGLSNLHLNGNLYKDFDYEEKNLRKIFPNLTSLIITI